VRAGAATTSVASLSVRIHDWALSRGWRLRIGIDRLAPKGKRVTVTVGPVRAAGSTVGQAVERLASDVAVEGWRDEAQEAPER